MGPNSRDRKTTICTWFGFETDLSNKVFRHVSRCLVVLYVINMTQSYLINTLTKDNQ